MQKLFIAVLSIILISGCATNASNKLNHGSLYEFTRSNSTTKHGYQIVKDPTESAPAEMVERFEVRSGDCAGIDCHVISTNWKSTGFRERSEISTDKDNYPNSEYWYGWSIFVPKDQPSIYPVYGTFGQFYNIDGGHTSNTCSAFMFVNTVGWSEKKGGLTVDRHFKCNTEEYATILTDEELRGNWNKIEVHAKWSNKQDGFFQVYANGILKYDFKGRTTEGNGVFFKYGIYRSSTYLWPTSSSLPTQIAYYANVKRAKTREGLAP